MALPPPELASALDRFGLLAAGETARFTPLPGGVSSDIWRVDLQRGAVCLKRALPRLKVTADWRAPVERNAYEVRWLETAGRLAPTAVPRVLGHDAAAGLFAMDYLDPTHFTLWKELLRQGVADRDFAALVGAALARIHAGTAGDATVAAAFPTDAIFHAIRLEPYLEAAARAHPDLAAPLMALVATTAGTKRALVHGDVSPKNILVGPEGPVFLDAECAWYGDPAFDLAFCLNHLLLKCLWVPSAVRGFLQCFTTLETTYRAGVTWEPAAALEERAARLLPGLLLARVDGKSPAEYVTRERDKARARRLARALLVHPPQRLGAVRDAWAIALAEEQEG